MRKQKAKEMRIASQLSAQNASDDIALSMPSLFPVWNEDGYKYTVDFKVQYNDVLYRCLTEHISQASWTPTDTPSLWVRIDDPSVEYPDWVQPVGSEDAYSINAKVTHNELKWTSDVNANIWEPGVSQWTQVIEH